MPTEQALTEPARLGDWLHLPGRVVRLDAIIAVERTGPATVILLAGGASICSQVSTDAVLAIVLADAAPMPVAPAGGLRAHPRAMAAPPPSCPGRGACHGGMLWCVSCGDVSQVCDDRGCISHPGVALEADAPVWELMGCTEVAEEWRLVGAHTLSGIQSIRLILLASEPRCVVEITRGGGQARVTELTAAGARTVLGSVGAPIPACLQGVDHAA